MVEFTLAEGSIPLTLTFPDLDVSILTAGETITIVNLLTFYTELKVDNWGVDIGVMNGLSLSGNSLVTVPYTVASLETHT